jgi:23S rRNA pseudouridine2604 synthase
MRINKLLSNYGYCSRKEAARLIEDKRVTVNGNICIPGQWVETEDQISLDGEPVAPKEKVYLALNKPAGITCTAEKTVQGNIIDFLGFGEYVFPVGRLDKESRGLILLTNDGELAGRILEADNRHEKEYVVAVDGEFGCSFLESMSAGVDIPAGRTRPCEVARISGDTFRIVLTQGMNRQIRRMCRAFGYTVTSLQRVRIMSIRLDGLAEGEWRRLSEEEIEGLRS